MLRRIHDPDRGASFVEYGAVIVLVSLIVAGLFISGIPRQISDGIAGAVDDALSGEGTVPEGGAGDGSVGGGSGSPEGEAGGGSDSPGSGSSEGEQPGSEGSGNAPEVEPAPYDPESGEGGAAPAVWTGDDFVVQQTWSFGDAWDWATGGQPAFEFEDHGDYNWDCGWVLHYFCRAGGGIAQGADGVIEDGKTAACHIHLCSHDSFKETWSNTGDGLSALWNDPVGSLGDMWDGMWETPRRNDENLSTGDAFVKDLGYWATQVPGALLKPFRFLGNGGGSSDRGGDGSSDRDRDGTDCSNSFVPGTLVLLANGTTKPIELMTVGDRVLATDPETGEQGPREVTHLITGTGAKTLVEVAVDDGSGKTDSVTATDNHPFWVFDRGWTDAIDLQPGDWLRTSAGVWVQVSTIDSYSTSSQPVHNLTVDDLRAYYVVSGWTSVLVHNSDPCPDWSSNYESAGDLSGKYTEGQSTRDPASQWYHEELSNEELLDSINNASEGDGIAVTPGGTIVGGHHRWDELQTRIQDGRIDPNTSIRIDVYGED